MMIRTQGPSMMKRKRVGTGTSVRSPRIEASWSLMKAEKGFSRKLTSPTRMLEASAPLGIFFMKWLLTLVGASVQSATASSDAFLGRSSPEPEVRQFHILTNNILSSLWGKSLSFYITHRADLQIIIRINRLAYARLHNFKISSIHLYTEGCRVHEVKREILVYAHSLPSPSKP